MAETWRLINSGAQDPATNMATDEALLSAYRPGFSLPTLRLYEWSPASFSLGISQDPGRLLVSGTAVRRTSGRIQRTFFVRRPTGGGLLWHDDEVTYSFIADTQTLGLTRRVKDSYAFITTAVIKALASLGLQAAFAKDLPGPQRETESPRRGLAAFCYSRHEEYDVCVNGKKIGGSAQKRRRSAFLQHGSLPLTLDRTRLNTACRGLGPEHTRDITTLSEAGGRAFSRKEVRQALAEAFARHFGVCLKEGPLSDEERRRIDELRTDKYAPAGVAA